MHDFAGASGTQQLTFRQAACAARMTISSRVPGRSLRFLNGFNALKFMTALKLWGRVAQLREHLLCKLLCKLAK